MKKIIALGIAFLPTVALAQGIRNVDSLAVWLSGTFIIAASLILAAAVVFFLWGVFQYVKSAGDEGAQEEGRRHIIWGIIGIAVMVSVWGLVNFLTDSAGLRDVGRSAPYIPTLSR